YCEVVISAQPSKSGSINGTLVLATTAGSVSVPLTLNASRLSVSGVSPTQTGSVGGGTISITGSGCSSAASVTFGGIPALSVQRVSAQQLLAEAPPHPAGKVDVSVTNGLVTPVLLPKALEYIDAPTLSRLSPNTGSIVGGWSSDLSGTSFVPGMAV